MKKRLKEKKATSKKIPLMVPVRKGRDDMTDWDERGGRWAKNIYNDEGNERHHVTHTVCVVYGRTEKQAHARAQFIEDAINHYAALQSPTTPPKGTSGTEGERLTPNEAGTPEEQMP